MDDNEIDEEAIQPKKKFKLFGRELENIPCFRNTVLNSFKGSFGMGLLTFLFTSRAKLAMEIGIHSFGVIGIGYWFYCRYQHAISEQQGEQLRSAIEKYILKQGTEVPEKTVSE